MKVMTKGKVKVTFKHYSEMEWQLQEGRLPVLQV